MAEHIYLDTCSLNRPSDDLSQPRIRQEAEAVARILDIAVEGVVLWSASSFVRFEIERTPDAQRRLRTLELLTAATTEWQIRDKDRELAHRLMTTYGFSFADALHLAIADDAGVDLLITVDDRLIRTAARIIDKGLSQVINPIDWMQRRRPWLLQPSFPPTN